MMLDATRKVGFLRGRIAEASKVGVMPPIEVRGEIWKGSKTGQFVEGRATYLESGRAYQIGVQLSLHAAAHKDDALLRAILVHEFRHAFFYIDQALSETESRVPSPQVEIDIYNDDDDRSVMADPKDWFGEEDVQTLIYHNDQTLVATAMNIPELRGKVPIVGVEELPHPPIGSMATLQFDDKIVNHWRALKQHNLEDPPVIGNSSRPEKLADQKL